MTNHVCYRGERMAVKQIAGRTILGEFAPKFAELNDDVLFGQVWSREDKLSLRDRSLITVVALMAMGLTDESFAYHLKTAKANGITKEEIAEVITHVGFYVGWPKAWAVFRLAKDIWNEPVAEGDSMQKHVASMIFPMGEPNDGYAQYFSGHSYLAPLTLEQVGIFNVTFEPGCRNNWHGAAPDSWFSHLVLEVPGENGSNEWLEPVDDETYSKVK